MFNHPCHMAIGMVAHANLTCGYIGTRFACSGFITCFCFLPGSPDQLSVGVPGVARFVPSDVVAGRVVTGRCPMTEGHVIILRRKVSVIQSVDGFEQGEFSGIVISVGEEFPAGYVGFRAVMVGDFHGAVLVVPLVVDGFRDVRLIVVIVEASHPFHGACACSVECVFALVLLLQISFQFLDGDIVCFPLFSIRSSCNR